MDLVEGTTTFTFREEGVPSELLASPDGHAATLSSTSIERHDILEATEMTAPDKVSMIDEGASQSATVSVSMNTAMRRMVDNLVDEEDEDLGSIDDRNILDGPHGLTPPNPTLNDWAFQAPGNITSYGMIGTLTAQNLLQDMPTPSPAEQLFSTPRPILPSIYNTPFAPLPSDIAPSPLSRPSTAKRAQGHSKQNSGNFSPLEKLPNGWSVHSSNISSMPDPSSMILPHTPPNGHITTFPPRLGSGTFGAGNAFVSSAVFDNSPWASDSARNAADSQIDQQDDKGVIAHSGQDEGTPKRGPHAVDAALRMCKRCRANVFRSNNELHKHLKSCNGRGRGRNVQVTPPNGQGG